MRLRRKEEIMSNWLALVSKLMAAAPVAVVGVEAIAGEKDGATKKQMALDALGLSSEVASLATPENKPMIDAATTAVSNAIDGIVTVANTAGDFNKAVAATQVAAGAAVGVAKVVSAA
jgi:hypothetical protein